MLIIAYSVGRSMDYHPTSSKEVNLWLGEDRWVNYPRALAGGQHLSCSVSVFPAAYSRNVLGTQNLPHSREFPMVISLIGVVSIDPMMK